MTHRRLRFTEETIGRTCVSSMGQHEVDQPAFLIDGPE